MAGGNPTASRQENDFYPTPPDVTRALLGQFKFDHLIHEPAAGNLAMTRVLEDFGHEVVSTDLVVRAEGVIEQDFLKLESSISSTVITNPPFNIANQFIEHGMGDLELDVMALLLKSTYWQARRRHDLFCRFTPKIIMPLLWRPDFMGLKAPTMEFSWTIWERGNKRNPEYRPVMRPAGT